MITLVNFADKNFRSKQRWNSLSAKFIGGVDKVIEFSPEDIDTNYIDKNKKSVKYTNKGFGNYFWKPYVIKKALDTINEGEYLMYADSGSFFLKSVLPLVKHMKDKKKEIACFRLPLIEKQWTKRDAFLLMDCDSPRYTDSPQILATFFLIKKSQESITFISEYKKFCSDSRILSDDPNTLGKENYPEFIEHRHDQSVLSLLCKKSKNILIEGDISDYGYFPYKYIESTRLYDKNLLDIRINKFKGIVISNRSVNPFIYLGKYIVKRTLLVVGIKS